jgi:putative nucleotidyltransferase with HDIG domain
MDTPLRVAAVVSALSHALDLSTGQPICHSVRSCLIGMRIAEEIGLSAENRNDLFYALLLKDCGCSGNASKTFHALGSDDLTAKRDVKITDWTKTSWETFQYALSHVAPSKPFLDRTRALFRLAVNQKVHAKDVTRIRCERGSSLARLMGLSEVTALGVLNLDEHWDGHGYPAGLRRDGISILSRIMLLAQTLEVFLVSSGSHSAVEVVNRRMGTWFDPGLVKAVNSLAKRGQIWTEALSLGYAELCLASEPDPRTMSTNDVALDNICMAFANIIDAKSPYTLNHSVGVANATVSIARTLALSRERVLFLRHAALLHDLGKLSVSNAILEKPSKLNDDEWQSVKQHPFHTWQILRAIPGFEEMSEVAGSHHEKLDGKGYFRGLTAEFLPLEARILAVADIFDALAAKRPYRDALPLERVFEIMGKDAPHALDPVCLEALRQSGAQSSQTYVDLQNLNDQLISRAIH